MLGTNGLFVLTGVPGLQAFVQADPARLMREMVLKNQVLLGTVNAGPDAFAAALRDLEFSGGAGRPWSVHSSPAATRPSRHQT